MILTALLSLLAGGLTVLAPCVLPFLPVIVGGSLHGDRRRPYLVAAALVVSLVTFTILLKAVTLVAHVDPRVWSIASGALVIILGLVMLFPGVWAKVSTYTKLNTGSHRFLDRAKNNKSGTISAILTGFALGPVFSSCSPTYAWVIAVVLPVDPVTGIVYLVLYCIGVAAALLVISLAGRKLIRKLGWAVNPRGWFQRTIAILFIVVGVLVATGLDKKAETWALDHFPTLSSIEEPLIPDQGDAGAPAVGDSGAGVLNAESSASQAPDFTGIQQWINSEPLHMEQLRGKVVLVDFWTYSCINCIRTQPYLNAWYESYHDQGLEIVGVHAPEFEFEKQADNVEKAVRDAGIRYPVALDNDYGTWSAYKNRYWPAKYLIDAEGRIRYFHAGEGNYEETEKAIRELLHVDGPETDVAAAATAGPDQSPETYLGHERAKGYVGETPLASGTHTYTPGADPGTDEWTLSGEWDVDDEKITATRDGAQLTYHFRGRDVYLVLGGPDGAELTVTSSAGNETGETDVKDDKITLDAHRLYHLVHLPQTATEATVTIAVPRGVSAHAFTFGS